MRAFPNADRTGVMPGSNPERCDAVARALASLEAEERRFARLGFAPAAERCRADRRYWEFLGALFAMAEPDASHLRPETPSWRGRDAR